SPSGKKTMAKLIETADVVISNYRPGVLSDLGLDYGSLSKINHRLVHVSITAFGENGPLASSPAMDIVVQGAGGIMGSTGEQGSSPVRIGAPIADFVGAYLAISAISLALFDRERSGSGQAVEVNLLDGQISMLANFVPGHAITGSPEGPQGS